MPKRSKSAFKKWAAMEMAQMGERSSWKTSATNSLRTRSISRRWERSTKVISAPGLLRCTFRWALGFLLRCAPAGLSLLEHLERLSTRLLQVDAQALQDAGRDTLALAHQAEEQVLGADVVVV